MDSVFIAEQLLNGIAYGLMLFLLAAGLTLVFGIMDTLNLAHGALYMGGAYVAASVMQASNNFFLSVVASMAVIMLCAMLLEVLVMRRITRTSNSMAHSIIAAMEATTLRKKLLLTCITLAAT